MNPKTIRFLRNLLLLFTIIVTLLIPSDKWSAAAQVPTPSDDDVNQIASQLYCPVCENVPLDECQMDACDQWRELIRQKLGEGWSEDEIKAFFLAQYGDRVLGAPPRRGTHWLLYVLPPLVFVIGIGLLFSKLKRGPESSNPSDRGDEDLYLQKVEQDLNNMDEA